MANNGLESHHCVLCLQGSCDVRLSCGCRLHSVSLQLISDKYFVDSMNPVYIPLTVSCVVSLDMSTNWFYIPPQEHSTYLPILSHGTNRINLAAATSRRWNRRGFSFARAKLSYFCDSLFSTFIEKEILREPNKPDVPNGTLFRRGIYVCWQDNQKLRRRTTSSASRNQT